MSQFTFRVTLLIGWSLFGTLITYYLKKPVRTKKHTIDFPPMNQSWKNELYMVIPGLQKSVFELFFSNPCLLADKHKCDDYSLNF